MAVFRVRPLPKGRQIGRKYRKPKLYSEKITKAHYTDKEKLDMLTDSIKQTKWEQCRLKAIGGHINEAAVFVLHVAINLHKFISNSFLKHRCLVLWR